MLSVPLVKQLPSYCGPASLEMVFRYFNQQSYSQRSIGRACRTTLKKGTSPGNMVKGARAMGFTAFVKKNQTWKKLHDWVVQKKIPIIVNWFSVNEGHYSVVTEINATHIWLADPEDGCIHKMAKDDFQRVWFDFDENILGKKSVRLRLRCMIIVFP